MEQYYACCLAAIIILIPLTTITHFIPPLPFCVLAAICNHTWIPECGLEGFDYRMFIDECDLFEYNCDNDRNYSITNYSDCFQLAPSCPPIPECPSCPTCKECQARRLFDPVATVPANARRLKGRHDHGGHEGHDHFVEHIHLFGGHRGVGTLKYTYLTAPSPDRRHGTGNPYLKRHNLLPARRFNNKKKNEKKKKTTRIVALLTKTTKTPIKKKPKFKTKTTQQVIETGTTASALFTSKYTIIKKGIIYNKVVKYIARKVHKKTTKYAVEKKDSDFLEK